MDIYELLNSTYTQEQEKLAITTKYKDTEIEVRQYLPLLDKFTFIFECLEKASEENGYVSKTKAEIAFRTLVMKYYTNIDFKDLADEEIHDICFTNGLMTDIFKLIPKDEIDELLDMVISTVNETNEANRSIVGAIGTINELLSAGISKMNSQVQDLDTNQLDKVIELAKSTGFKE